METCGALRAVGASPRGAPGGPTVRASLPTGSTIPSAPCANLAPILRFGCVFRCANPDFDLYLSPNSSSDFDSNSNKQLFRYLGSKITKVGVSWIKKKAKVVARMRRSESARSFAKLCQNESVCETPAHSAVKRNSASRLEKRLAQGAHLGLAETPKFGKTYPKSQKAVCWGVFLVFWRGNCVRTPSVDRAHSGALAFRCPASCPALFRHLYKGWFSRLWPDGSVCGPRHLRQ